MFFPVILGLGTPELVVILLAILLLFGASAIPKLARSIGKAQGEFQKARGEFEKEVEAGRKDGASEEQIRRTARDLGIEESGMSLDDVKAAINEKVG